MKFDVFFLRILSVALIAGSVPGFTACSDDDDPEPTGTFKLAKNTVKADYEGGAYSVSYTPASATVSAACEESWILDLKAEAGKVSFTAEANGGDKRTATVTVTCAGTDYTFDVEQGAWVDPTKITMADLEGKMYGATICQFFDETIFWETMEVTGSGGFKYDFETGDYVKITAREYAEQYVADYKEVYPDGDLTVEDAMAYGFYDGGDYGTYAEFKFEDGCMEYWYGAWAPAGGAGVLGIFGDFTFDEETGILSVYNVGNEYEKYWVNVEWHLFKVDGGGIVFEPIKWPQPHQIEAGYDITDEPMFMLSVVNFAQTSNYVPVGKMQYFVEEIDAMRNQR